MLRARGRARFRPFSSPSSCCPFRNSAETSTKPASRNCRHSSAPFRKLASHCASSQGKCGSREVCRARRMTLRYPQITLRTIFRLCSVLRAISLMDTPSPTRLGLTEFASSGRRHPACCKRSVAVRSLGWTVAVSTASRTCRVDLRTASSGVASVFHEMPAVGDLFGVWQGLC